MYFDCKKAYKSLLALILALVMCVSFTACGEKNSENPQSSSEGEVETEPSYEFTVAVIESVNEEEGAEVYEGFESSLTAAGYKDGENILIIRSTPDEAENLSLYAENAISAGADLIFTIGEDAAVAASAVTDTVPVIFACVADPIESGLLTSCEVPDGNVTGVSDFVPVYHQLEFVRKFLPKTKNVSVLYCETEKESILVASLVQEEAKDFAINASTFTATTERNLNRALESALADADLLYLPEDTLTKAMFSKILKAANKEKIPVLSAGEELVSEGAFITVIPDYKELGYTAGEMVLASLKGLKTISEMPVIYPQECVRLVNRTAAKTLGIDISDLKPDETLVITKTE